MRKVIAVIILLALGLLLIWNPSIYKRKKADEMEQLLDERIEEKEILPLAIIDYSILKLRIKALQKTPDQIMNFNGMLMKVMYSGDEAGETLSDKDIQLLAKVQREYFQSELLDNNPEQEQLNKVVEEVEKAREGDSWIVGYEVQGVEYSPVEKDTALVTVRFIPNSIGESTDIYQRYLLEKDREGLWFIKGWIGLNASDVTVVD